MAISCHGAAAHALSYPIKRYFGGVLADLPEVGCWQAAQVEPDAQPHVSVHVKQVVEAGAAVQRQIGEVSAGRANANKQCCSREGRQMKLVREGKAATGKHMWLGGRPGDTMRHGPKYCPSAVP